MNQDEDIIPSPIEENENRNPLKPIELGNPRLRLFTILYPLFFLYLLGGMAYRQLIQSSEYEAKGERQSLRRVLQPGPRGDIYDRKGRLLVGNRPRFSAVVYPEELRKELQKAYYDKVREYRKSDRKINRYELRNESRREVLQQLLDQINAITGREETVDMKHLALHFKQRLLLPLPLVNDLSPHDYAQLIEQLPAASPIKTYTDSARFYPYKDAAAHVLGFVGRTHDIPEAKLTGEELTTFSFKGIIGRAGLEKSMDHRLSGKTGGAIYRVDPVGYQYGEPIDEVLPIRGQSVTTSLDIFLQRVAEQALGDKVGAVACIDIQTGEILVLASKPNYDLNLLSPSIPQTVFDDIEARGAWFNRAIQGNYPPGSTFKIITAIAAMRHAYLDPSKAYECGPFFKVGNRNFPEHGHQNYGMVDLPYSLQVSSNVYYYQIGLETGVNALALEAKRFGMGTQSNVELPAEAAGVVPTPEWKKKRLQSPWLGGDTANMSIGQGYLLATPLQMAALTASFARKETQTNVTLLHDPLNNRAKVNRGGEMIGLTQKQYQKIIEGMERAALSGGTASRIQIPELRIAAKTGSAQHRDKGQQVTVAWTIAFAPIENPQIAIAVMVEGTDPDDNYYGGKTAAPVARAVIDAYFNPPAHWVQN